MELYFIILIDLKEGFAVGKIIDISEHQGVIDFAKLKNEVDLVIIRVQYGSQKIDKRYKEYVAECKKYGIPFGHYAYACFVSVEDAKVEAKDFLQRADKDAKFLVVDVEEVTTKNPADLVPATQAFIDYLKQAGVQKVGLYTGHHFYKQYGMNKVKADFLWIPRYGKNDGTPNEKPDFPCDIWQYTDKGKIAGIKGYVDLNMLIGSKPLEYFTGKDTVKQQSLSKLAPAPKPTPKQQPKVINGIKVVGEIQIVNVEKAAYICDIPSQKSKNLGIAPLGSRLPIAGSVDGWWEVIYQGKHAYVNEKFGKMVK